jgi:5'-nucleotidase/UDP-sugar diphosphatase
MIQKNNMNLKSKYSLRIFILRSLIFISTVSLCFVYHALAQNSDELAVNTKKLTIIHTNDLHSRLLGYPHESEYTPLTTEDDNTIGGFARIARITRHEKYGDSSSVLVLDAGDFLMGTLFQELEPAEGFQLRLMKEMGYDAVSIGNHEFDFGIRTTAEIIRNAAKKGNIPPVLLANIKFSPEPGEDDDLEVLYSKGIIKPYTILERSGLRIGIFGILGYDASDVAPYIKPAKIEDPIKTARRITNELRTKENVDLVVCLSHSGLSKDYKGNWDGEDVKLASKIPGIDIIISGHTHTQLSEPIFIGKTIIVQAGVNGAYAGKLQFTIVNKQAIFQAYKSVPINDSLLGDFKIHGLIENQKQVIQERILNGLGIKYDNPIVSSDFDLLFNENMILEQSNLGPLLADAIRYYINSIKVVHTDCALIAAGVIRDQLAAGVSSIPDIFRISSMGKGSDSIPGYPLSMVYVTGNELKKIFEVLLFAYKSSADNYCYYSGMNVSIDPDKGFLRKVISIEIEDPAGKYKPVDFSKKNNQLYSIAANSYILEFVGLLKKMTYGIVRVYPKDKEGQVYKNMKNAVIDMDPMKDGVQEGKEWLALYKFVSQFPDTDRDGIPDIPYSYKKPMERVVSVSKPK